MLQSKYSDFEYQLRSAFSDQHVEWFDTLDILKKAAELQEQHNLKTRRYLREVRNVCEYYGKELTVGLTDC